jgi:hypothetical protein
VLPFTAHRRAFKPEDQAALEAVKTPQTQTSSPLSCARNSRQLQPGLPNPRNPPLYLDLPTGEKQQAVLAKWAANSPLAFLDQYVGNLRRSRAIALDVGDQDGLRTDTGKLHDALDIYGIVNSFEIYPGTHTSNVAVRFQDYVLPFFNKSLSFEDH